MHPGTSMEAKSNTEDTPQRQRTILKRRRITLQKHTEEAQTTTSKADNNTIENTTEESPITVETTVRVAH